MSRVLLCRALEDNSPSVANLLHFERLHSLSGGREGPGAGSLSLGPRQACAGAHFLRAAALPPLAPAFFFCAVVPPCLGLEPDPDFLPPRLEAPGLLAMRAARDFDMPFLFSFSYCFSFLTLADLDGISAPQAGRHTPSQVSTAQDRV